ncbi:MAG: RNA polymerase sigma-70 factor [bacterium]|nr:RNA polymerase sigma-70 factor [bacterium]
MLSDHIEVEWIKKIRKNDSRVFEKLVGKYFEPLYRFAWRYVKDQQNAENIVQDVFLKTWLNRKNLDPSLSISSYLYRAVRNNSLNFLRDTKNNHYPIEDVDITGFSAKNPEEEFIEKDRRTAVNSAIDELPEKCRIIFLMKKYDGMSYSEIADILNISQKTVENQIGRALKILRRNLTEKLALL